MSGRALGKLDDVVAHDAPPFLTRDQAVDVLLNERELVWIERVNLRDDALHGFVVPGMVGSHYAPARLRLCTASHKRSTSRSILPESPLQLQAEEMEPAMLSRASGERLAGNHLHAIHALR